MYWSGRLPPCWLPPSCLWRSGGERRLWWRREVALRGSWVSSASPPRDGGERMRTTAREAGGGCCWHEGGGFDEPRELWRLHVSSHPPLCSATSTLARFVAARLSSWPPRAASSCLAAPRPLTQSWSQSLRQTPTPRCLWGWCTGCCRRMSSWPGAGRSPSPSPERGLSEQTQETWMEEETQQDFKMIQSEKKSRTGTHYMTVVTEPCQTRPITNSPDSADLWRNADNQRIQNGWSHDISCVTPSTSIQPCSAGWEATPVKISSPHPHITTLVFLTKKVYIKRLNFKLDKSWS